MLTRRRVLSWKERSTAAALVNKLLTQDKNQLRPKTVLDHREIFHLAGWIKQVVPDEPGRQCLAHRLNSYLNGKRRGSLKLPKRLATVLPTLVNMTKSDIRKVAYWVKPGMSADCALSKGTISYLKQAAPVKIWTRSVSQTDHGQGEVVKRLPRNCKPGGARPSWPSTPDLFETLELSRRGKVLPRLDKTPIAINDCLSKQAISDDIRLASRVVGQQIVGIRTTVKVPEDFLGYFRSYHGFLILTGRYKMPAELVRFLIAQWVKVPTSLWLVENCPFKFYLKRHKASDFIRPLSCRPPPKRCGRWNGAGNASLTSVTYLRDASGAPCDTCLRACHTQGSQRQRWVRLTSSG